MTLPTAISYRLFGAVLLLCAGIAIIESGGGVVLVVLALFAVHRFRRRWPGTLDSGGRARFANAQQCRAADMIETGLHLGELVITTSPPSAAQAAIELITKPLSESVAAIENWRAACGSQPPARVRLRSKNFAHATIVAASRSGKGASILVPTLITYPGPILMLDPQGENFLRTLAARQALGRRGFCIDPWRIACPDGGDTYNPMEWVTDSANVPDIAKDFANATVIRNGQEKEPFFANASEQIIQAVIAAVLWGAEKADRNLVNVADIISNPKLLDNTLSSMLESDAYGGVLRNLARQASRLEGREKASVLSTVDQSLGFLNSKPVRDTIRSSNFDPLWLKTRNADVFLAIPPEKLRSASGFSRYILTGILRRLAEGPPDESNPVLVILDEAAALGQLQILEDAVTLLAGWGVKMVFVWQSLGQIQDSFPGEKTKTFMANMSLQIFGKTNDLDTAKLVSEKIGDTTVLSTSTQDGGSYSRSTGYDMRQDTTSHGTSWSVTRNETSRRLVKPEEILAQPPEIMTVFTDRTPPILVRQVRYYQPEFWSTAGTSSANLLGRWVIAAAVLCLVLLAIVGLRHQPALKPAKASNTPNRVTGRPAGGNPIRPDKGTNDGQEDRRRPRQGNVPQGTR